MSIRKALEKLNAIQKPYEDIMVAKGTFNEFAIELNLYPLDIDSPNKYAVGARIDDGDLTVEYFKDLQTAIDFFNKECEEYRLIRSKGE